MGSKKYLVIADVEGERCPSLNTAAQIINLVDMSDCYEISFRVYDLSTGEPVELQIHGCWHDPKHPLYIKATDAAGNVVLDGHGTDH